MTLPRALWRMRLFDRLARIQLRMSATSICAALAGPTAAAALTGSASLLFSTFMADDAEDFFQETWIRVLERGHQYDGKSRFEAWLFSIARHLVIDWQRQKKAQSLDALTNPDEGAPMEFADDDPSPLHLLLAQESEETAQASLEKLPAVYREVLLLRFQEELGLVEIATVLNAPLSTVKSRLYRGLEDLRGLLGGEAA